MNGTGKGLVSDYTLNAGIADKKTEFSRATLWTIAIEKYKLKKHNYDIVNCLLIYSRQKIH